MNGKKIVESLMVDILPLAKKMLAEHGEFLPYGGWINMQGEIVHVGAKHPSSDHPKSVDLINILKSQMRQRAQAHEIQAAGIVYDVRVMIPGAEEKSDAIQINLEHVSGYSAQVFFPYELDDRKSITFGKIFAQAGEIEIFGE